MSGEKKLSEGLKIIISKIPGKKCWADVVWLSQKQTARYETGKTRSYALIACERKTEEKKSNKKLDLERNESVTCYLEMSWSKWLLLSVKERKNRKEMMSWQLACFTTTKISLVKVLLNLSVASDDDREKNSVSKAEEQECYLWNKNSSLF